MEPWEKSYDKWLTTDPNDWYNWYEYQEAKWEVKEDWEKEEKVLLKYLQEALSGPLG